MSRFTAFIEGTKFELKKPLKSILAYPVLFVARRIFFALSAVYLVDFLWVQLAIQTYVSFGMIVYL
jgi:hypothetical protein